MLHTLASGLERLQDPSHEQKLAMDHYATAPSDSLIVLGVIARILSWNADGHSIGWGPAELDIDRMEYSGEATVYDVEGMPVMLKPSLRLVSLDRCWGASPKRTMHRLMQKIETPSQKAISDRALSRMFWLDVSSQIMRHHAEHQAA